MKLDSKNINLTDGELDYISKNIKNKCKCGHLEIFHNAEWCDCNIYNCKCIGYKEMEIK